MESVTRYIETNLLLKVNRQKSKIGRPKEIKYLGFTFYKYKEYKPRAHKKSVDKIVRKLKFIQKLKKRIRFYT